MVRNRALLVDGGATLFPEVGPPGEHELRPRVDALASALPELTRVDCHRLALALGNSETAAIEAGIQHSDAMTAALLERFSAGLGAKAAAVRLAMVDTDWGATRPFAGAEGLLRTARELGFVTVLLSNTTWHSEPHYWDRMRQFGLMPHLAHIV